MSAAERYRVRVAEARAALRAIEAAIAGDELEQAKDPDDWGHAGSMRYVADRLREALDHLVPDRTRRPPRRAA